MKDSPEIIAALRKEAQEIGVRNQSKTEPNGVVPERAFGQQAIGKIIEVTGLDTFGTDEPKSLQAVSVPYAGTESSPSDVAKIPQEPNPVWAAMIA